MKIQNAIKAVMTAKDLKVSDVAKKAGLSATSISEIKAGRKNTSLDTFNKLAKSFDMGAPDLMRLVELEEEGYTYQVLLYVCLESMKKRIRIYGNY